MTADIGVCLLS